MARLTVVSWTRTTSAICVESSPLGEDDLDALEKLIEEKKKSLARRAGGNKSRQSPAKKE